MMEVLKMILFGIVEGITEWLPISSTGHMILLNEIVKLDVSDEFYSVFQVVIQLGAIMAVVILFWNKIWPFGKKRNPHPLKRDGIGRWIKTDIFILWFHIIVACIPAVIVGVTLDDWFEAHFYNYLTVAIMLILFGVAFILIENYNKTRKPKVTDPQNITYKLALYIGLFQLIAAIFPGTSRSGATIVGALLLGVSRTAAAEFTFYLAIPVMFGASLLKLLKYGLAFSPWELFLLVGGMAVAFVVSLFVIKFLMGYIKKHDFKVFGYYRIVLGAIVLLCGALGFIGA
ncbi:MAG: undecaprenyl-diphosphate phosphatase [Agathobacter sp.]|nr:undecaprenyl-diphosphate phosphatase [Agathobacter sp.]MDY3889345.1 undecaprenyl-diphosphate phosphatase [Agathobacter sp.]